MHSRTRTGSLQYPKIPWTPIILMGVALVLGMGKWAVDDHIAEFRQSRQETNAKLEKIDEIVTDIRIKLGE